MSNDSFSIKSTSVHVHSTVYPFLRLLVIGWATLLNPALPPIVIVCHYPFLIGDGISVESIKGSLTFLYFVLMAGSKRASRLVVMVNRIAKCSGEGATLSQNTNHLLLNNFSAISTH